MYCEAADSVLPSEDVFKQFFKRFKSRKTDVDQDQVVDFYLFHQHMLTSHSTKQHDLPDMESALAYRGKNRNLSEVYKTVKPLNVEQLSDNDMHQNGEMKNFGLKPVSEWGIYCIDKIPGLIFIMDPFTGSKAKHYWIKNCLTEYPQKPNTTNLDAHSNRKSDLWTLFVESMNNGVKQNQTEFFRLRWVTLGYQYDWNTKLYYKDRYSNFPEDLSKLSKYLAKCLGYSYFNAEAGIVNYYHLDSTLAGHTDHSEYDMDSPLFSISFGCDAIFLIGGKTKNVEPVPIYLRNGDILVMAGESRLAYHAVPRIIAPPNTAEIVSDEEPQSENYWIFEYMKQSRININIRQVLREGEQFPDTHVSLDS